MTGEQDADQLAVVATASGEFEASTIAALLESAGIEAFTFPHSQMGAGAPLSYAALGVPVQVRRSDLEAAQHVLAENRSDFEQLDWDQLEQDTEHEPAPRRCRRCRYDLGTASVERCPGCGTRLGSGEHMPLPARISFVAALLIALAALAAMVVWVFL